MERDSTDKGLPGKDSRKKLTVEELEKRVAPSTANKKAPIPPPYAPGTDYGLVRRENLNW
ncbi:MAG: hypothetical protein GXP54_04685 [Deltaproteobacteria bacterium]|nr:hypothetical protein [Deltaproteobacteria bacterium]